MTPHRIYIVGAQSTGKMTLINAIAEHFHEPQNRRYGREVIPESFIIKEGAQKTQSYLSRHSLIPTKGIVSPKVDASSAAPSRNRVREPVVYFG